MRANADVLSQTLGEGGLDVLTGGTDTHLLQVDLRRTRWTGKEAEERLDRMSSFTGMSRKLIENVINRAKS